jgi:Zn-dependent peptidase ImmA (M78 family)
MIDLDKFPDIPDKDIEEKAQSLVEDYFYNSEWSLKAPVPVERIAESHLGYDIEITDEGLFEDPDFLGGIHFDAKLIQVNGSIEDQEGRYNFTIAHELGHHCLHKETFETMETNGGIMCREQGQKPIAERQADYFAASLLMPRNLVMKAFEEVFGDTDAIELTAKNKQRIGVIANRVIKRGNFDNVSLTAMTNRLIGIGLVKGIGYQSKVTPGIEITTLSGVGKYYLSIIKKLIRRVLK